MQFALVFCFFADGTRAVQMQCRSIEIGNRVDMYSYQFLSASHIEQTMFMWVHTCRKVEIDIAEVNVANVKLKNMLVILMKITFFFIADAGINNMPLISETHFHVSSNKHNRFFIFKQSIWFSKNSNFVKFCWFGSLVTKDYIDTSWYIECSKEFGFKHISLNFDTDCKCWCSIQSYFGTNFFWAHCKNLHGFLPPQFMCIFLWRNSKILPGF